MHTKIRKIAVGAGAERSAADGFIRGHNRFC